MGELVESVHYKEVTYTQLALPYSHSWQKEKVYEKRILHLIIAECDKIMCHCDIPVHTQ